MREVMSGQFAHIILSITTTILLVLQFPAVSAQTPDIQYGEAEQLLAEILGDGVQVFSVALNGHPTQFGTFTNGNHTLGIDKGIFLTTGNANIIEQGGDCNAGNPGFEWPSEFNNNDADLDLLAGSNNASRTAAILEISFQTSGTTIEFDYVFASGEYPCHVLGSFNDVFGFFLSGPGYEGSFTSDAENVALLPTGDPVSIHTVNSTTNSNYFNDTWFCGCGFPQNPAFADFVYGGRTVVLHISANVECGKRDKLKMAVGNVADKRVDSGVFIRSGSFKSPFFVGDMAANPTPICEGSNLNLSIAGNQNWHYQWSTGDEGTGLTSITTVADQANNPYSVTVTNPETGCILTGNSITANIHPQNNIPPYSTGINGTNGFTAYGQAGQELCFNVQTVDNPDENTLINEQTLLATMPSGMSHSIVEQSQESVEFCWTPSVDDFGVYTFEMTYADNNVCGVLLNTDQITVHVLCPNCPLGIAYENRTPGNNPLPAETRMGEWITAGLTQPVNTGEAEVLFQAGERIEVGPYFTAGPGYTQEIVPTCVDEEDCASCCDDWAGFTYNSPLSQAFTPNGDNCNDVWYVQDTQNPCAFNAMGFRLEIRDNDHQKVYEVERHHEYCCPFTAPEGNPPPCPTSVPQQYSSIFWPGISNQSGLPNFGNNCYVIDGVYFYVLELYSGCGHTQALTGFIHVINSPGPSECTQQYMVAPTDGTMEAIPDREWTSEPVPVSDSGTSRQTLLIGYAPEYETAHVRLNTEGQQERIIRVEVFAMDGRLIAVEYGCIDNCSVDLVGLSSGVYTIRAITDAGIIKTHKIVKR